MAPFLHCKIQSKFTYIRRHGSAASLNGERQMQYGEKRAKEAIKKARAQNNFKILPKNRAPGFHFLPDYPVAYMVLCVNTHPPTFKNEGFPSYYPPIHPPSKVIRIFLFSKTIKLRILVIF